MWCKQCQQDVRAIMLSTEMGRSPHCPRCGDLLRLANPRPEAIEEMADVSGDFLLAKRPLPTSFVSSLASGEFGEGASITLTASRRARRADISIDWQWDEDRRALRRIHAALEGGAMYRFDRGHLPTASATESPALPFVEAPTPEANASNPAASALLFVGLATLSAGAAFFGHGLWTGATNGLGLPLIIGGQTLVTFSLLFQIDVLRRSGKS